jgi:ADP-heptose:LPS heptosyltransferase
VLCVLVVRFRSVGAVLLTTPLVRALARRHPEARLVFVTTRALAPLVADHPGLADVVALEPDEPLRDLGRRLRAFAPTHGLDLHGTLETFALRLLVPCHWRGYPAQRVARAALVSVNVDFYGRHRPVAERYFDAARGLDVRPDGGGPEFFLSAGARDRVAGWLAAKGLTDASLVALAPGATHATKQWPLAHWIALAQRLRERGHRPIVLGGPDDRGVALQVAAGGAADTAAGELSLQETGALLAKSRVAVSGDTGLMHMATGVATPVVALFGPTVSAFGFFPYQAPALVLECALACRPCSVAGTQACPLGHHRCLREIAPDQVVGAVERLAA